MIVASAYVEANGTRNPVFLGIIHQKMGDTDAVIDLVSRLLGGLSHDRLVGLAVNHDLPTAFTQILPRFRVLHDRQAPVLELMHR